MATVADFGLFQALLDTSIGGFGYLVPLALFIFSMGLITRDVGQWKTLALPASVGWMTVGVPIPPFVVVVSAVSFALTSLSIRQVMALIQSSAETTAERLEKLREDAVALTEKKEAKVRQKNLDAQREFDRKLNYDMKIARINKDFAPINFSLRPEGITQEPKKATKEPLAIVQKKRDIQTSLENR